MLEKIDALSDYSSKIVSKKISEIINYIEIPFLKIKNEKSRRDYKISFMDFSQK